LCFSISLVDGEPRPSISVMGREDGEKKTRNAHGI
jgi:hypothetical protein